MISGGLNGIELYVFVWVGTARPTPGILAPAPAAAAAPLEALSIGSQDCREALGRAEGFSTK